MQTATLDQELVREENIGHYERDMRYVPELDGIRAIAVLFVIFSHISQNFPDFLVHTFSQQCLRVWINVCKFGWVGVDIFFVLSGFLISGILLDAKDKPHYYKNFIARRALRILPLYYVILVVMFFFFSKPWAFLGLSVVFLSNFSVLFGVPMLMGPLWSLSVEEHFYLIWPWFIRFLSVRNLILVCTGIIILEPIFRMTAAHMRFFSPYFSWFRIDGLALGALIAGLARTSFSKRLAKLGIILIPVALLMFGLSLRFEGTRISQVGTTMLYSEVAILVGGLIAFIHVYPGHTALAFLRTTTLRFIGNVSYCLYLIHMFVIMRFYQVCFSLWAERFPDVFAGHVVAWYFIHTTLVLSLSFVIGHLSMRYFEGPIRRYRVRFE